MKIPIVSILILALLTYCTIQSQEKPYYTVDIVQGNADMEDELFYFYENNWKVFRDSALSEGYISAYNMILTSSDSLGNFQLLLLTEYPDSLAFAKSEENFNPLLKKLRPKGPMMLNETQRADFLDYLSGYEGKAYRKDSRH